MSGNQPIGTELLYASYVAGSVSVPTASPGSSATLGFPAIAVPPNYMKNTGSWASSLRLLCGGLFIATATLPTISFGLYGTIVQPAAFSTGGSPGLIGSSALYVASATTTGCSFEMEWNIGLRTMGVVSGATDATSTVTCFGNVTVLLGTSATAIDVWPIPAAASSYTPQNTAWPASEQVYLWPTILVTGATAGNTVTMEWVKLYGEN